MRKICIFKPFTTHCSLFPVLCSLLFVLCSLFTVPCYSLSLDETLSALAAISRNESPQFRWDPVFQDGVFKAGDHWGAFSTAIREGETGFLMFDNRELYTVPLPYNENGRLIFPEAFVITLKDAFRLSFESDISRISIAAIIIDPGHGGRDPGAIGRPVVNGKTMQLIEKDIVLKVAKDLKTLLSRVCPGKRIMMTRETDIYLSLDERVDMANSVPIKENEAIIYVSIHANYAFNRNARGYEVFHLNPEFRRNLLDSSKYRDAEDIKALLNAMLEEEYASESIILGRSILSSFGQTLGTPVPSRGLKKDEWAVIRNSRMPAVLVELGFLSNPQDAVLMTSEDGLRKLTEALYKGIMNYIGIFERPGVYSSIP